MRAAYAAILARVLDEVDDPDDLELVDGLVFEDLVLFEGIFEFLDKISEPSGVFCRGSVVRARTTCGSRVGGIRWRVLIIVSSPDPLLVAANVVGAVAGCSWT